MLFRSIAASSALVPMATMVIPIIKEGILKYSDIRTLPSTKISAHFISSTKPNINSKTFNSKFLSMLALRQMCRAAA